MVKNMIELVIKASSIKGLIEYICSDEFYGEIERLRSMELKNWM